MKLRPRASRPPVPQRRRRKVCAISPHVLWLVFLRLPLKSVFRCKAVCKAFHSVVSDPLFSADYRRSSPRRPAGSPACAGFLVVQRKADDRAKFDDYLIRFIACVGKDIDRIPSEKDLIHPFSYRPSVLGRSRSQILPNRSQFLPDYKNSIIASSGGVLLCAGVIHGPQSQFDWERYSCYVVNPLTREWRALPRPPIPRFLSYQSVVGFICREGDPSEAGACKYNYEVLHIYTENMIHYVQTYSTSSHKWSMVSIASDEVTGWSPTSRVMAIGDMFYWMSWRNLICYDPTTNNIEESPLPNIWGSFRPLCVGDGANGALLLCISDTYGFEVWVKDDCRQMVLPWRSKLRIEWRDIERLAQRPSHAVGEDSRLLRRWHVWDFQEDPDKMFIERFSEVYSYDLRTEKLEMLHDGQGWAPFSPGTYYPYHLPSWHFELQ